jgi:nucleoside-diphosphate-sugar epimerase
MNVLVCGARGFIGQAVCGALRAHGHRIIEGTTRGGAGAIAMDFAHDRAMSDWLPRLAGIDAVVNAVGVLRTSPSRSMADVHEHGPAELFEACARSGTRRVVQVSALGIAACATDYARTKRAAECRLDALTRSGRLDGVIVRPSVVFGRQGASSRLFLALSRLPALVLPRVVCLRAIQPVAVVELAGAIAALVEAPMALPSQAAVDGAPIIEAVGPEAVTIADFIASLRAQSGQAPARVGRLPDRLTHWSARLGDLLPAMPWCSTTLALLARDNVGDPGAFADWLGRPATRFDRLLETLHP